jgi:hypothetical protein
VKRKQPESAIQRDILKGLKALGFVAVHVPNGSKLAGSPEQRARAGKRLKADGMLPGFPDLIVYASGGRVGHIEVKAEGNYQQDTQKAVQAMLEGMGHHYAVCRSILDVPETLNKWGWLR